MQFLTSRSVIYIRVILLLTAAFWIATDAQSLFHSNFVLLLGEAMRLPIIPVENKSVLNGIISLLLVFLAVNDLIPCMADNIQYFETAVPARLLFYFMLAGYIYMVEDRMFSNNVTFVYSFLEVWINYLIFMDLREERYLRLKTYINEHGEELQREQDEQVRAVPNEY